MKHDEFWVSQGIGNLTPQGKTNPEGWDLGPVLRAMCHGTVLDIGCGNGRLAKHFNPDSYLGVDISPACLASARHRHPDHAFQTYNGQSANTALLYTVLLHVSDDDVQAFADAIHCKRIVVAEVMGRHWRRDGDPPVYNREPEEYEAIFLGRRLVRKKDFPYRHYPDTNITFMVFDEYDGGVRSEIGGVLHKRVRPKTKGRRGSAPVGASLRVPIGH